MEPHWTCYFGNYFDTCILPIPLHHDQLAHRTHTHTAARMLLSMWSEQIRFLQLHGEFFPNNHVVKRSLPQGDCFSMLGMCALLTPIANHIQRKHPSCVQALYADDRSFTCSTATEIWQVRNEWHVWSNKVGLQENPTKEQYYQRNVQGCRSL